MYKYFLVAALVVATVYAELTLETCKCWDGYAAKQNGEGKIQCEGLAVKHIQPCNLPKPPKCICTEDTVTAIMTDNTGTWCQQRKDGVEVKKWPCENKEEWATYKTEYAEYEKTLGQ